MVELWSYMPDTVVQFYSLLPNKVRYIMSEFKKAIERTNEFFSEELPCTKKKMKRLLNVVLSVNVIGIIFSLLVCIIAPAKHVDWTIFLVTPSLTILSTLAIAIMYTIIVLAEYIVGPRDCDD